MSSSGMIARALNSARRSNIVGHDSELDELVREYFLDDERTSDREDVNYASDEDEVDPSLQSPSVDTNDVNKDKLQDNDDGDEHFVVVRHNVPFTHCEDEAAERTKVQQFNCKCSSVKSVSGAGSDGRSGCCTQFDVEEIMDIRLDWTSMSSSRKDDVLMGLLIGQTFHQDSMVPKRAGQDGPTARKIVKTNYSYKGRLVCRTMFQFLVCTSRDKLYAIKKHVLENGVGERTKRTKAPRKHALAAEDVQRIVLFLQSYAEDHALVLPGRVQGFSRTDIRLLPSSHTKYFVHQQYLRSSADSGNITVALTTFKNEWKRYCPEIVVTKPATDLCWVCQDNNTKIHRSSNKSTEEKAVLVQRQDNHLAASTAERALYNHIIKTCKDTLGRALQPVTLQPHAPNSGDFTMHYSFDFAQQVHLPSNPMQPGPIYFLTPRKCGIFGVNCEALPQQINFLIDEGMAAGKGSSAVISYLHFFFENFGLGEQSVELHCDNCAGQNKNQYLLQYLAWRTMTGLHTDVQLHFMLPGHTKFAPGWCFGLLKRKFRRTAVSCLEEMAAVVSDSTHHGINRPQLVGTEGGQQFVPSYDWQAFFAGYGKPFRCIKGFQHFHLKSSEPGMCHARQTLESTPETRLVLDPAAVRLQHPPVVPPPGLSAERQKYLYENIRQFVKPEFQDRVCPPPR